MLRTKAGGRLRDYLSASFVYEADDTEPLDVTGRILAIEAEAASRSALFQLAQDVVDYCNDPKLVEQARAALAETVVE